MWPPRAPTLSAATISTISSPTPRDGCGLPRLATASCATGPRPMTSSTTARGSASSATASTPSPSRRSMPTRCCSSPTRDSPRLTSHRNSSTTTLPRTVFRYPPPTSRHSMSRAADWCVWAASTACSPLPSVTCSSPCPPTASSSPTSSSTAGRWSRSTAPAFSTRPCPT